MPLICNLETIRKIEYHDKEQYEFAEKILKVPRTTYNNWANSTSRPFLEEAFRIACILGKKVDDLWTYKE